MGGHKELEEGATLTLDWGKLDKVASKRCNVVPVVVQDSTSGAVLIAAYFNEVALAESFVELYHTGKVPVPVPYTVL